MNFFKKLFNKREINKDRQKDNNNIVINPHMPEIVSSVIAYCPKNVEAQKVIMVIKSLLGNSNDEGNVNIFKAMAKIKQSHEFLEKMHGQQPTSTEWIENYGNAMKAVTENTDSFVKEQKEVNKKLEEFLKKYKDD